MLIPPKYFLTPKITTLLQQIEAAKAVIDAIQIPPEIETNIRRQSTLKSSLFSARIEGNPLTLDDVTRGPSKDQRKVEVFNILKAQTKVSQRGLKDLTTAEVLNYHHTAMSELIDKIDLGHFRHEASAIYNSAGIAIYLPPRPALINSLLHRLITYLNSSKEPFVPVKAVIGHYIFEKIHPFIDGNGRVGRLLLQATLKRQGYDMKGLLSLEEYLDKHRADYYEALDNSEKDITDYIEFMLTAIAVTAHQAQQIVQTKQQLEASDYLLPRRAEILNIIKDHQMINFDMVQRRFMSVNARTLRYDLKKLVDAGLVKKLGTTNGVWYQSATN